MLETGSMISSPGGAFIYRIQGSICRLYDREELPWPSCNLRWRGKQPSWNRIGRRLVPDMGPNRYESYSVTVYDQWGGEWESIKTFYELPKLSASEKRWWYSPRNERQEYPDFVRI